MFKQEQDYQNKELISIYESLLFQLKILKNLFEEKVDKNRTH